MCESVESWLCVLRSCFQTNSDARERDEAASVCVCVCVLRQSAKNAFPWHKSERGVVGLVGESRLLCRNSSRRLWFGLLTDLSNDDSYQCLLLVVKDDVVVVVDDNGGVGVDDTVTVVFPLALTLNLPHTQSMSFLFFVGLSVDDDDDDDGVVLLVAAAAVLVLVVVAVDSNLFPVQPHSVHTQQHTSKRRKTNKVLRFGLFGPIRTPGL